MATAILSSKFYTRKVKADLQKEYESRFNEKKWVIYTGFADYIRKNIEITKGIDKTHPNTEMVKKYGEFVGGLWIVGSDEVIKAFLDWKSLSANNTMYNQEYFEKLVEIMIEMRKDLGYKNSKITTKDLLATFMSPELLK